MTLLNCCNILKIVKKMVLLGVVDMRQLSLKLDRLYFIRKGNVFQEDIITGEQKLAYLIEIKRSKNIQIKTYYSF